MAEAPGSPTFSHSSSEESELADPVAEKFGRDCLVAAIRDADHVQQLIEEGNPVTANAVLAACYVASARSLEVLLSAGSGPDVRLETADGSHADVKDGWSSADITPNIGIDKREWFALQHAATGTHRTEQMIKNGVTQSLLPSLITSPIFTLLSNSPYGIH